MALEVQPAMRNMSFRLTTAQFLDGTKDVTRRLGWAGLKPGEHFMAVRQAQGLKRGEKIERLGECVCIDNYPEKLLSIIWAPLRPKDGSFTENMRTKPETAREGFPELTPEQFVAMFCREMGVEPGRVVNRIEFARVVV